LGVLIGHEEYKWRERTGGNEYAGKNERERIGGKERARKNRRKRNGRKELARNNG
jgi:hypothetical protein